MIGGPVGKPGGNNKLFFFYTHEYRPRTAGNTVENFRMPTAEERRGDFSQTLDNNGALYNLIYDASTGQPKANCSATIQTACFQDGGVVGRIPISRLYGPGMAMLNQYPLPNNPQVAGRNYNYSVTLPVQKLLSYTPTIRLDYQASQNLRATWKFSGTSERVVTGFTTNGSNARALPGFTDSINKFPLSFNTSGTVNYTINEHDVPRGRPTASTRTAWARRRSRRSRTRTTWSVRRTSPLRFRTARSARLRPCSRTPASSIPASTSTARCSRSARRSSKTAVSSFRRSSTGARRASARRRPA